VNARLPIRSLANLLETGQHCLNLAGISSELKGSLTLLQNSASGSVSNSDALTRDVYNALTA
jgi:hypothetical protein